MIVILNDSDSWLNQTDVILLERLLTKLDYYGIRGNTRTWIKAFITPIVLRMFQLMEPFMEPTPPPNLLSLESLRDPS
jgi:hypothetical protein